MGRRKKWTTRRGAQRGAPDGKDEDVIAQGECVQRARLLVPVPDLSFSVHRAAQHRAACTHGQKQRSTTGGRHITGVASHARRRKHGTRWEWHALGCATGCQAPARVHAPSTLMRNAAASRNVKPFLLSVDRIGSTMLRSSTDPTAGHRGGTHQTGRGQQPRRRAPLVPRCRARTRSRQDWCSRGRRVGKGGVSEWQGKKCAELAGPGGRGGGHARGEYVKKLRGLGKQAGRRSRVSGVSHGVCRAGQV